MNKITRTYHPGSEWVYFKIYTGPKTADTLLTSLIKPVASKLLKNGLIEKWFFIRYEDPKFHLRVRFKIRELKFIGIIINEFNDHVIPFLEEDMIWKIQLDTYQREVERYGAYIMDASESIFFYDSIMVMDLLDLVDDSDEGEELRWLFGIKAIDAFLNSFDLSEEQKLFIIEQMKVSFCQEFHINRMLKKQLDKKFITHKNKIEDFLEIHPQQFHQYSTLINCIDMKTQKTERAISNVKGKIKSENLYPYLSSCIHMTMNRLFRSNNRLYEMVIYYFMFKHYKTISGRKKFNTLSVAQ